MAEAGRLAVDRCFGEARVILQLLRFQVQGSPWEAAIGVRLQELGDLEAQAEALQRQEKERVRAEMETRRAAEERARREALLEARQAAFLKLLPGLPSSSRPRRLEAFEAVLDLDPTAGPALAEALAGEQGRALSRLKNRLGTQSIRTLRLQLEGELAQRRKTALALILDPVRYPYLLGQSNPYGPDGPAVQREVDGLVGAVLACWQPTPQTLLDILRAMKGFEPLLDALDEVEGYLARSGHAPPPASPAGGMLAQACQSIDFAKEAEAARENAEILAANEASAERMAVEGTLDAEEADCVLRVNRYRIMMGLRPLRIEPRLVQASRGHSRDMGARRYFSHFDPDGKGPVERARAAGFPGGLGVGENIAYGKLSGKAAFQGWCASSGHHRALLKPGWTLAGAGRSGSHWTMMFGGKP